jgi:hypothetical protein
LKRLLGPKIDSFLSISAAVVVAAVVVAAVVAAVVAMRRAHPFFMLPVQATVTESNMSSHRTPWDVQVWLVKVLLLSLRLATVVAAIAIAAAAAAAAVAVIETLRALVPKAPL